MDTKNVAVIGGAGYAGIELVRYLLGHPGFRLLAVTSDTDAGKPLSELYPALTNRTELVFTEHDAVEAMTDLDAVFLAVPHTAAMAVAPRFLAHGISVFDLSADFRLKDVAVYEEWYGVAHTAPDLLPCAIYGLPEINRSLLYQRYQERMNNASSHLDAFFIINPPAAAPNPALIACPGCYPTASVLAVAPVLVVGFAAMGPVVINAISGASGAGRSPRQELQFCGINESVNAYAVATHRHTPEIAQALTWEAERPVPVVFTPHLAPMTRGLLATVTLQIKPGVSTAALESVYKVAYAEEPFVQLLPYGVMPRTASVVGTNNAQVGIMLDEKTGILVASCAIDNLGKGAASQAIQCANIVFGFDETMGLITNPGVI
ncbi:MAG: N-acetyl-gamma-glutamyl-phosphate reductase [Coriobacteriales bacterium]|jgi:N-acetyl-gamma-glutamyl-phosphate reductase|nr:N-acetyl-gamma-glutamyl-phosphate reductase [Coriobacteriales bacterium]